MPAAGAQPRRRLDAYGQFEFFVLQSFVQSMLPKNATNVFGKGSAGEFWKSMLAEKMGDELARSGQVGIARRLAAGPSHPVQPGATNTASPLPVPPSLLSTLAPVQPRPPDGADVVDPRPRPLPRPIVRGVSRDVEFTRFPCPWRGACSDGRRRKVA